VVKQIKSEGAEVPYLYAVKLGNLFLIAWFVFVCSSYLASQRRDCGEQRGKASDNNC